MFITTAIVKGIAGAGWAFGWVSLFVVDLHVVRIRLSNPLHNDILGVLMVMTVGIVAGWKRRAHGGGTYSQGVVDGMRLAAAGTDLPAPRRGLGAKVLYLHGARNGGSCTQGAPKAKASRSSS